jgi:hypothetical protein
MSSKSFVPTEIPIDESGNIINDIRYYELIHNIKPKYKPNIVWHDTLTFKKFNDFKTSIRVELETLNGEEVHMFISDFSDIIPLLHKGTITGYFRYIKQGTNFSVQYQGQEK